MPKITFKTTGQVCEVQNGESILDVAIGHDVPLQHACGGFCACTTCHVIVHSGADRLSPMEEEEQERIQMAAGVEARSRLSCQAKIHGDVTVEIVNLD